MRNVKRFTTVFLLVAAVGCAGVAMGDINITGFGNNFIQTPLYQLNADTPGNSLQFSLNQGGDQSSLGTCTMNPMSSNAVEAIIEEMPMKEPEVNIAVQDYGRTMSQPMQQPTTPRQTPIYPDDTLPDAPPPPPTNVPEPSTMLILGLAAAAALPFSRRFRERRPK